MARISPPRKMVWICIISFTLVSFFLNACEGFEEIVNKPSQSLRNPSLRIKLPWRKLSGDSDKPKALPNTVAELLVQVGYRFPNLELINKVLDKFKDVVPAIVDDLVPTGEPGFEMFSCTVDGTNIGFSLQTNYNNRMRAILLISGNDVSAKIFGLSHSSNIVSHDAALTRDTLYQVIPKGEFDKALKVYFGALNSPRDFPSDKIVGIAEMDKFRKTKDLKYKVTGTKLGNRHQLRVVVESADSEHLITFSDQIHGVVLFYFKYNVEALFRELGFIYSIYEMSDGLSTFKPRFTDLIKSQYSNEGQASTFAEFEKRQFPPSKSFSIAFTYNRKMITRDHLQFESTHSTMFHTHLYFSESTPRVNYFHYEEKEHRTNPAMVEHCTEPVTRYEMPESVSYQKPIPGKYFSEELDKTVDDCFEMLKSKLERPENFDEVAKQLSTESIPFEDVEYELFCYYPSSDKYFIRLSAKWANRMFGIYIQPDEWDPHGYYTPQPETFAFFN